MKAKTILIGISTFLGVINCYSQSNPIFKSYVEEEWNRQILICFQDNNVMAYFSGRIGQNEMETFFTGQMDKNIVNGKSVSLWSGFGETSEDEGSFRIEMNSDRSKILLFENQETESIEFGLVETSYGFTGIKNFRSDPNTKAKILSKIDLDNTSVELIAIGNVEKIGSTTDFWYKVKINSVEGWVFGGLYFR